ncbi:MAG: hypothetical protein H6582_01080 [Crocinitomicaceae bacterium]|nr:hypothetical protein [Crocinitomicaceae bacterium]
MDVQASKIELAKLILNIENPSLLQKISNFLKKETKDFALELTDYEKQEIELAIKLIDQGHSTSYDDFLKKIS